MNFKEWLSRSDQESSLLEFYDNGEDDQISKSEESDLAKGSALKTMKVGNWTVKPTTHGAARAAQRVPDYKESDWKALNTKMVDQIDSMLCTGAHSGKAAQECLNKKTMKEIIFYSRSMKQGYVVAYDPSVKELRIVTVFKPAKNFAKAGTVKVLMESDMDVVYVGVEETPTDQYTLSGIEHVFNIANGYADKIGYVVDRDQIANIVKNAVTSNPTSKTIQLKIPMFSKASPSGAPEGYLDFEVFGNTVYV